MARSGTPPMSSNSSKDGQPPLAKPPVCQEKEKENNGSHNHQLADPAPPIDDIRRKIDDIDKRTR